MRTIHYFNITYRCNSNCVFCAADHGLNDSGQELTVDEFDDVLSRNDVCSGDRVIINGGEPTVHRRFFDILDATRRRGAYIDIYTNGVKLHDRDFVQRLLTYSPMLIRIPLFGASPATHDALTGVPGNFSKVMAGIENILALKGERRVDLEIKLLLCKATAAENRRIFDLLAGKYPREFHFSLNPLLVSERVKENGNLVFERYSESVAYSLDLIRHIRETRWPLSLDLLPFCLFPREFYERHLHGVDREIREYYSDPNVTYEVDCQYTSRKCARCILRSKCAGFPGSYLEFAGEDEVVPIEA